VGGEGDGRSADCPPQPPASPPAPRRRVCFNKLLDLLNTVDWSIVKSQVDASVAYDLFETQLVTCISACTVEIEMKKPIKKLKPWITNSICKLIDKRNKLYEKVKFRSADDKFKQYYNRFRNNLSDVIKATKLSYFERKFETSKGNSKLIWKTVNEIAGQKKLNRNLSLNINNNLITDPKLVANEFNNYFLTVVENVVGHNNVDDNFAELPYKNKFPKYTERRSFMLSPVLTGDVEKIIKSLKNGKSPGLDGVSSNMLKIIYPAILDVLTFLINLSFETVIFPEKLKNAVVIPIHKSGSFALPSNFRPISLISTFAKIYEKIMKQKMLSFLNITDFFSDNQYGFRKGMNTELALLNFMDNVTEGINKGKCTSGLFLDIKKAFDTVDHRILLGKLHDYGFRGVVYDWFGSYLNKRQQCVKINGAISYMGEIKYGVPQGSVLGAILFIIFINDFCNGQFHGKVTAFADDTALCYIENSWEIVHRKIFQDLGAIKWWFVINKLVLSAEKSTFINFSLRQGVNFSDDLVYKCNKCLVENVICGNCSIIKSSNNTKYLGLVLDSEMSWKLHISRLKNKIISSIRLFYFIRNICPLQILRSLYLALVNSRLEYGLVFWGGTYLNNLKSIIILQKLFVKVICNKTKYDSSFPCFQKLNIFPLRSLFIFKVLKLFHKNLIFNRDEDSYKLKLRNASFCTVPKPNSTFFTKSYYFIAPRIYNKLPKVIKTVENHKIFLRELRKWLMTVGDVEAFLQIVG
jgi:hypothetical protein